MLNIGRLGVGAADYYLGEVAASPEDYYTGRGESPGRWIGSLASSLGLKGQVEPEAFSRVLAGKHPSTGQQLTRARGAASRARHHLEDPNQGVLLPSAELDLPRAAARLGVGVRRVRQLIWAGSRCESAPERFLRATQQQGSAGRPAWRITVAEVDRLAAARETRPARPGYDLTLRPPKSVSLIWALGDEGVRAAVREAHRDAVDEVVKYVERHALSSRKRSMTGTIDRIETDGLIGAVFDHRTSRAGDPLLHSHVVVANMTRTVEGRWVALDARGLYSHARPAGFLYQAHLRHALTERLRVQWQPVRNGWAEVDGVPKAVIRAFSKRRNEIEEMVAESGYTSARAHQAATLQSRQAKERGLEPDILLQRWCTEAGSLGFGPEQLAACLDRPAAASPMPNFDVSTTPDGQSFGQASGQVRATEDWHQGLFGRLAGPTGLTRMASNFRRRDVVAAVSEWSAERHTASEVQELVDRFLASDLVVGLAPSKGQGDEWLWRRSGSKERDLDAARYTTPELLALEHDVIQWATEGGRKGALHPPPEVVDSVLAMRSDLSAEQAFMVRALARTDAPMVQPVGGRPGSGKTHATSAYVAALAEAGIPVVGCALSATAAAELEAACSFRKVGREASTIARLLGELGRHPLEPSTVIVVDEASMVGTRDLHRLCAHAADVGGGVKLIGDPLQHGAVEAGGVFRHLCDRLGESLVTLEANNRQEDPVDLASIDEFRDGLIESAIARYDAAGRIHRCPTAAATFDGMAKEWYTSVVEQGGTDPMIAGPNRVRHELNCRARTMLDSAGALTGPALVTADGLELQVGDWVVTRRNDRRLVELGGRGWVKNGSSGVVSAIHHDRRTVTVRFHRDGEITIPALYLDTPGNVEHGYARTTYGVQGATLDHAHYFAGDETSFEEGYVAFTRGRISTHLYLVDGSAPSLEPDLTHRSHTAAATGLDTVTEALAQTRANDLAHDADPLAHHGAHLRGRTLASLRHERLALEAMLAAGPPNVAAAIAATEAERDRLVARQRASGLAGRAAGEPVSFRLRALDNRLADLEARQAGHDAFLLEHADTVQRLAAVRRGELARELHVRTAAVAEPRRALIALVGARPTSPIDQRGWASGIELAAVHSERFEVDPSTLLAERPADINAALSYERTRTAIEKYVGRTLPEALDLSPPTPQNTLDAVSL